MTRIQFDEVEDTVDEGAQVVEDKVLEGEEDIVDEESETKVEKEASEGYTQNTDVDEGRVFW